MARLLLSTLVVALLAHEVALAQPTKRPAGGARRGRPAAGAPAGEPTAPAPTLADLETILPKLRSANGDEVREAIDLLAIIERPEVVPHLDELLRAGQPDAITDRALEALGVLGQANAIPVLTDFTRHRRAATRLRAYRALALIRDGRVRPLLERGLSDSDRSIRAAAALALGEIGARESIEVLFRAFDRGVIEAATAIGKLGDAGTVERFGTSLGQRPLTVMLSGYHEYLRRGDLTVQVKTAIVNRLGEVSGPAVRQFLEVFLTTLPSTDRTGLKRTVEETIRRIPPGPGPAAPAPPAPAAPPPAPAAGGAS